MRIAVNARFLTGPQGEFKIFIREMLSTIAEQQQDHEFIYFTDGTLSVTSGLPANIKTIAVGHKSANVLSRYWWNYFSLPTALKKYKADIIIQTLGCYSEGVKGRSVLVTELHNLAGDKEKIQTRLPDKMIEKATLVIAFSVLKPDFKLMFPNNSDKFFAASLAVKPVYKPIDWEDKETIKHRFASGCEYFLFHAGIFHTKNDLITVLKAFSLFKVRQHTNMKLVISGLDENDPKLDELKTYKFREGVRAVWPSKSDEQAKLMAAAYALLFIDRGFSIAVAEAVRCEVPVIAPETPEIWELTNGAILPADMNDPQNIAEQLKRIYKDENLRSRLVLEAKSNAECSDWNNTAADVWKVISAAVSK